MEPETMRVRPMTRAPGLLLFTDLQAATDFYVDKARAALGDSHE